MLLSFFGAWTFAAAWNLLTGWFSASIAVGIVAVAVAILTPQLPSWISGISDLRKWAAVVAVCSFGYAGTAAHNYSLGLNAKQSEWNAARQAADVEKARREKEIAENAAAQVRRDVADEQIEDKAAIGRLNEYIKNLQARGDSVCRLNGDHVRGLSTL